jgi:hypothetical protein
MGWAEKVRHDLNSAQTKTKQAIFAQPTLNNITWDEVVSLLKAVGCIVTQRGGSATLFTRGNDKQILHRPHPGNTLKVYAVKEVRDFLIQLGETP